MRFLGILLLLGGYTLVYASVANGGKFATDPWAGLFTDAYDKPPAKSGNTGTGSGGQPKAGGSTTSSASSAAANNRGGDQVISRNPLTNAWNIIRRAFNFLP